jgi:hypothetical protein
VDVVTSASAEAFHGKGGNFFSTVLTAGIAVHL